MSIPRFTGALLRDPPWSVVLAGGNGNRMRPFTEGWLGRHVPKQYCAFSDGQTMLEDALDRAARLSGSGRTFTVVAREHLAFSDPIFGSGSRGYRVVQPRNRDTAAGIYLGLTYVRKCRPDATVVILPSDHFLRPEGWFLDLVRAAVQAARDLEDRLVLVGAVPDAPEPDYGWMVPGPEISKLGSHAIRAVREFVEKPHEALAENLMAAGALWNTFVMVAPMEVLWDLGWQYAAELMPRFEILERSIATPREFDTLDAIYEGVPEMNFSSAVLQRAVDRVCMVELEGVAWSDWGRPDRVAKTLARFGMTPAFRSTPASIREPAASPQAKTVAALDSGNGCP